MAENCQFLSQRPARIAESPRVSRYVPQARKSPPETGYNGPTWKPQKSLGEGGDTARQTREFRGRCVLGLLGDGYRYMSLPLTLAKVYSAAADASVSPAS